MHHSDSSFRMSKAFSDDLNVLGPFSTNTKPQFTERGTRWRLSLPIEDEDEGFPCLKCLIQLMLITALPGVRSHVRLRRSQSQMQFMIRKIPSTQSSHVLSSSCFCILSHGMATSHPPNLALGIFSKPINVQISDGPAYICTFWVFSLVHFIRVC